MSRSDETRILQEVHGEAQQQRQQTMEQTSGQKADQTGGQKAVRGTAGRAAKGGKQTGGEAQQTGGKVAMPPPLLNKRPPGQPAMMPREYVAQQMDDDLPDFDAVEDPDEAEYEKLELQEDLRVAVDEVQDDEEKDAEEEDENMEEEEEEEAQTDEPNSVSPASEERASAKVLQLLTPALAAVRGDEHKRLKEATAQRDESVNRREGSTLITIIIKEPNYGKMGRMIGSIHRMEGIPRKDFSC